jgi:hypothetical protein
MCTAFISNEEKAKLSPLSYSNEYKHCLSILRRGNATVISIEQFTLCLAAFSEDIVQKNQQLAMFLKRLKKDRIKLCLTHATHLAPLKKGASSQFSTTLSEFWQTVQALSAYDDSSHPEADRLLIEKKRRQADVITRKNSGLARLFIVARIDRGLVPQKL